MKRNNFNNIIDFNDTEYWHRSLNREADLRPTKHVWDPKHNVQRQLTKNADHNIQDQTKVCLVNVVNFILHKIRLMKREVPVIMYTDNQVIVIW